ncbi:hypothetical protein SLEP1_g46996 [Rubroshorea leprosula]|uniref:Rab-GAP TBC domain-containing protein n=1 Tax=Rubroshorea leprosula TaxID=152421 RepID=A0AAV5LP16_9ROSI|nr:hypothetical protein SLEP1_g46996 [Rubroshorea leprosula]
MHSSIGTGSLAYPIGSKVMDMRSSSKDERQTETIVKSRQSSIDSTDNIENSCDLSNNCTDMSLAGQREISSDPTDLVTLRVSTDVQHVTILLLCLPLDTAAVPLNGEDENDFVPHEDEIVDVVRTDSHLEVYKATRNLARMSDILAVYAWVDPATGMSDLLSSFAVLFEDNADAFWCFEMLIRRLRKNFQMEGRSQVMKQLQAFWHILELTDGEMFAHLSNIGAESLHFAFPMLLVLF